jgi:hypothetical protein
MRATVGLDRRRNARRTLATTVGMNVGAVKTICAGMGAGVRGAGRRNALRTRVIVVGMNVGAVKMICAGTTMNVRP